MQQFCNLLESKVAYFCLPPLPLHIYGQDEDHFGAQNFYFPNNFSIFGAYRYLRFVDYLMIAR